jgi:aspartate ammonia-lyase
MSTPTAPATKMRTESDSMGKIDVPSNVYWGGADAALAAAF